MCCLQDNAKGFIPYYIKMKIDKKLKNMNKKLEDSLKSKEVFQSGFVSACNQLRDLPTNDKWISDKLLIKMIIISYCSSF